MIVNKILRRNHNRLGAEKKNKKKKKLEKETYRDKQEGQKSPPDTYSVFFLRNNSFFVPQIIMKDIENL